ncbi:uncharacterized protein LOC129230326 [Uloborus diversus]|uniref:uncharacterized protein LOC129230326 n=1 Tax=Uloborus diversus TaxID=327109 RepID=UPI00240A40FD|nr:uncharacterized protein LOC129230326 [Uloborus diversus]
MLFMPMIAFLELHTVSSSALLEAEKGNAEDTFDVPNTEVSRNESSIANDTLTDYNTEASENELSVLNEPSKERGFKAKYSSHARYLKKRRSINKCRPETLVSQMTLSKTLCFCYLGLIYIEDQFTLSDVIRFANEGRIPYFNAADCLPSTMKLQYFDYICFTKHTSPDLCKLSMMCAKLVQFLDLPSFKNRSLLPLVCRYVKDLNLSNDLIPVVKNLLAKFSENHDEWYKKPPSMRSKCFSIPVYENRALAFIIIALKMLFVLDGNFEKEHSNVMMKINALNQGNKYFVWNEWYQHCAVKEYLFIPERISFPRFRRIDYLSAEQIISNHPISELKPPNDDASANKRNKLAAKFAIKELLFKVAEISKEKPKIPTVFPLKSEVKHFLSTWESMAAYKDNDGSSFTILSKDFSSSSLDYDISFTESAEDIKSLLISTLYKSVRNISVGYSSVTCEEMVRTTSKYWFKNYTQRDDNSKTEFFNKLPSTFRWLLSFLSRYICTEIGDLYFEVVRIEKILFFGKVRVFE